MATDLDLQAQIVVLEKRLAALIHVYGLEFFQ